MKLSGVLNNTNTMIECTKAIEHFIKAKIKVEKPEYVGNSSKLGPSSRTILLEPSVANKYRKLADDNGIRHVDMLEQVWAKYVLSLHKDRQKQLGMLR